MGGTGPWPVLAGLGLVHRQAPAAELGGVQRLNRLLGTLGQLDEPEPPALAGLAVRADGRAEHPPVRGEHLPQRVGRPFRLRAPVEEVHAAQQRVEYVVVGDRRPTVRREPEPADGFPNACAEQVRNGESVGWASV